MKNFVVTVGRQFGSMGRPIAKKVAEILDISYYDRDIVEEVSKRMNAPLSLISDKEEGAKFSFGKYTKMLRPLGSGTTDLQDKIFSVQECVLQDFADKGPCIMVGRCSDYLMRDRENLLRIYIYAPLDARIRNCVQYFGMTEEKGRKMCMDVDKARKAYHKHYAGYEPGSTEYMDLMLNSNDYGIDGTAELLANVIRKNFGL